MGMYGTLRQVTQQYLSAIDGNPDVAYDLVLGTPEMRVHVQAGESRLYDEMVKLQQQALLDTGVQDRYAAASRRGEPMDKADQEAYDRYNLALQQLVKDHSLEATRPGSAQETGLDKAWHGLHFLLTGRPHGGKKPWSLAILGGKEVADRYDLMSFGGIRKVNVQQTATVAAALAGLPVEDLIARYNPLRMKSLGIYAMGSNADQDRDYLAEYYECLCRFYAKAASENCGALFYIA